MAKFSIRYIVGHGPDGAGDVIELEAATFKTVGDFTDFYSNGQKNLGGLLIPSGEVVMRVRNDLVADIRQID
jgi:hypothetical protein